MHLILIGLRGSGKTSAGRRAAGLSSRPVIDLDDVTESVCGMTAKACFETAGEATWRTAEAIALERTIASTTPSVIALGGGTPTAPGVAALLEAARDEGRARIVRLHASTQRLVARIAGDPGRPALTGLDPGEEMKSIEAIRGPLFARLASSTIDTEDRSVERVAAAIVDLMA